MNLIVNTTRIYHWSHGVRRYFSNIMKNLIWESETNTFQPRQSRLIPQRLTELVFRGSRDSLIWTPCLRGPINAYNHIVTVHDCINIEYVLKDGWRKSIKRRVLQKTLDNANSIIAISDSTRNAILKNYNVNLSKVIVIKSSSEVEQTMKTCKDRLIGESRVQSSSPECRPFILMVTNSLPHKNTTAACQALVDSQAGGLGVILRVVGSLSLEAHEICRRNNFPIIFAQDITDYQLAKLYTGCLFLFSPSLSEGHNLPISEALYFGANVLCSDIEAHREFYEGKVDFFNPLYPDGMIEAINQAILRDNVWHPQDCKPDRTHVEVARDYQKLFESIY